MSTEQSTVDAVARFAYHVTGELSAIAGREDLSLTQLRMLGILRGRRPRMSELGAALGIDRSSVTGLIVRAEQRGLVERSSAPGDGRGVTVGLTAAGDAFAARVAEGAGTAVDRLLAGLSDDQRDVLRRLLLRVLAEQDDA